MTPPVREQLVCTHHCAFCKNRTRIFAGTSEFISAHFPCPSRSLIERWRQSLGTEGGEGLLPAVMVCAVRRHITALPQGIPKCCHKRMSRSLVNQGTTWIANAKEMERSPGGAEMRGHRSGQEAGWWSAFAVDITGAPWWRTSPSLCPVARLGRDWSNQVLVLSPVYHSAIGVSRTLMPIPYPRPIWWETQFSSPDFVCLFCLFVCLFVWSSPRWFKCARKVENHPMKVSEGLVVWRWESSCRISQTQFHAPTVTRTVFVIFASNTR